MYTNNSLDGLKLFINEEVKKLHKKTLLENKKLQIEKQLKELETMETSPDKHNLLSKN